MYDRQRLLQLAPTDLPRGREQRYKGEGFSILLDRFAGPDRDTIRDVYLQCDGVYQAWLDERDQPEWPTVRSRLAKFRDLTFVDRATTLGRATLGAGTDEEVLRVLHDIRGGGLAALLGLAELVAIRDDMGLVRETVMLARDHAKMMRQAIEDLDPESRASDAEEKQHDIGDVAEKWEHEQYHFDDATAAVRVDCSYEGGLASRCLEAAAVDRVLYNFVNNATRFAADDEVALHILPVGDDVRFVVANAVSKEHADWLMDHTKGDLTQLFSGGITRGGEGLGLSNCAQLVAAAYGQAGTAQATARGHLGASLDDGAFFAWFHWPQYP